MWCAYNNAPSSVRLCTTVRLGRSHYFSSNSALSLNNFINYWKDFFLKVNHTIYLTESTIISECVCGTAFKLIYIRHERKVLKLQWSRFHCTSMQLEKANNNQLTELETNCVIQPSLLCLRLRISLATRIFGKPKWSARPRVSGRVRAASNPSASSAAAEECNTIIWGGLPAQSQGWPGGLI